MKIGFFTETYLPRTDGVAYSIENFRQALEKLGHEVYIFAPQPKRGYKESNPRVLRFPSIRGLPLEENIPHGMFFPPAAIRKAEKIGLDIVHFHTPTPMGLLGAQVALKNHLPLITTYHTDYYQYVKHYPSTFAGVLGLSLVAPLAVDGDLQDFRKAISMMKPERSFDEWSQKMVSTMSTVIHNRCDLVIAPSVKIKRQLAGWGTTVPIKIVPNGVDEITTDALETKDFQKYWKLAETDQITLMVGRMGPEKNVETLINAFAILAPKNSNYKLMLVGDHPVHLAKLKKLVHALKLDNQVIFTGRIDHEKLGAAYANASVLCFPSLTDTHGMVVSEAAHAGLPIVMIDHDITDVMIDGLNGYYAAPDPSDVAAKIESILTDPQLRAKFSAQSRHLADGFTAGKQATKLLRLYQEVLDKHNANR